MNINMNTLNKVNNVRQNEGECDKVEAPLTLGVQTSLGIFLRLYSFFLNGAPGKK